MYYALRKIISTVLVLLLASVVCFLIIHMIPGDPATVIAGSPSVTEAELEAIRARYGLDLPLYEQYFRWLANVLRGDFGVSILNNQEIGPILGARFYNTVQLAILGTCFAVLVGIPLGIIAAVKHNTVADVIVMMISVVGISMPIFWIALLLMMVFAVNLGWLPATGADSWQCLVLPTIAIGMNSMASIARMTRTSMLDVMRQDYVRTAEAKGLPRNVIIFKHTLKNAMIPIVTTVGTQFGYLIGGAVLVETVFVYPGVGRYLIDSIGRRDYLAIQGCMLIITAAFVVVNTAVDLVYHYLDPRVKE